VSAFSARTTASRPRRGSRLMNAEIGPIDFGT